MLNDAQSRQARVSRLSTRGVWYKIVGISPTCVFRESWFVYSLPEYIPQNSEPCHSYEIATDDDILVAKLENKFRILGEDNL